MLKLLFSLINPLESVIKEISALKKKKLDNENDKDRLEHDERIKVLEARRDSILSAQSDPFERWVRIGFAVPFILYVWKLVIWDKLLQFGVTDNLSTDLWTILYIVLGGYFVDTVVRRIKK